MVHVADIVTSGGIVKPNFFFSLLLLIRLTRLVILVRGMIRIFPNCVFGSAFLSHRSIRNIKPIKSCNDSKRLFQLGGRVMKQSEGHLDNPRVRILSSITTPYEDLLVGGDSDAQNSLGLIKLKIALSTNLLSIEQVHEIGDVLHRDDAATMGVFTPIYEPWTKEMVDHIVDNEKHLKKHRVALVL